MEKKKTNIGNYKRIEDPLIPRAFSKNHLKLKHVLLETCIDWTEWSPRHHITSYTNRNGSYFQSGRGHLSHHPLWTFLAVTHYYYCENGHVCDVWWKTGPIRNHKSLFPTLDSKLLLVTSMGEAVTKPTSYVHKWLISSMLHLLRRRAGPRSVSIMLTHLPLHLTPFKAI